MKTLSKTVLLLAAAFALTACETDLPPEPKTEGPLTRGLSGQGSLGPIDKKTDPVISGASSTSY